MEYAQILQNMSLEEIRAVVEILQKSSDSYIYVFDLDTDTYMMTSRMQMRFPFEEDVVENATSSIQKVIYPSDYNKVKEDIVRCVSGEQEFHAMEYRWLDRDNRIVWISCKGTVIRGAGGHRLLVGRVTELGKEAKADNITGLRREIRFQYDAEEILRDRPETIRYMMRIGIDNFKEINEKEGPEAGDNVLRELADCIVAVVDPKVDVYRLMADEFIIVDAFSSTAVDVQAIYNEIRNNVAETVRKKEYSCFYTVSAGVIQDGFESRSAEEILKLTEFAESGEAQRQKSDGTV